MEYEDAYLIIELTLKKQFTSTQRARLLFDIQLGQPILLNGCIVDKTTGHTWPMVHGLSREERIRVTTDIDTQIQSDFIMLQNFYSNVNPHYDYLGIYEDALKQITTQDIKEILLNLWTHNHSHSKN